MIPILLVASYESAVTYIDNVIKELQLNSSTVFKYYPDPKIIKIDTIRDITYKLHRSYPQRRLFVIFGFDTSRLEAQNAFLKTLEEDFTKAQFILVAENESNIVETIRSRCRVVRVKQNLLQKTQSSIIHFYEQEIKNKDDAINAIDNIINQFRGLLKKNDSADIIPIISILKESFLVRSLINVNNVNPVIALDHLTVLIDRIFPS